MTVRLVVRAGEPRTVGDVLSHHGILPSAVGEGRVFLGTKRVDDPLAKVKDGDALAVESARDVSAGVEVLSEYRDLYAVSKPPGLPTEPDRSGTASVVHSVARLLQIPPDVLHAATRLDAQVSGIAVIARGAEAARFAASLKEKGQLRRRYFAIATRAVEPPHGTWDAPIGGDPGASGGRSSGNRQGARQASSRYAVVASSCPLPSAPTPSFYVVEPITGRTHQIRIHASLAGAPLMGDVKYGGPRRVVLPDGRALTLARIALHAARVQINIDGELPWTATAPLPDDLTTLWSALGGDPTASERALGHSFRKR